MSCNSIKLNGIAKECDGNVGGIKKVYMIADGGVSLAKTAVDAAEAEGGAHTVPATAFTLASSGTTFMAYNFAKNTGGLTTTVTSDSNGVRYSNAVALQFNRMEGKKHLEIEALAAGDGAQIFVIDRNNIVWFIGYDNAASLNDLTAQTGSALEDLNGYNTTLTAVSGYMPFRVEVESEANKAAFAALVAEPAEDAEH